MEVGIWMYVEASGTTLPCYTGQDPGDLGAASDHSDTSLLPFVAVLTVEGPYSRIPLLAASIPPGIYRYFEKRREERREEKSGEEERAPQGHVGRLRDRHVVGHCALAQALRSALAARYQQPHQRRLHRGPTHPRRFDHHRCRCRRRLQPRFLSRFLRRHLQKGQVHAQVCHRQGRRPDLCGG